MSGRDVFHGNAGSKERLIAEGPVVAARLRPGRAVAEIARMRGLDLPYVDVNLLIDTGASTSFVERHVVEALGIASIRRQVVALADHKSVECLVYRATIDLPLQDADDHSPKMTPLGITIAATPNATRELPHHGLLGRDFLSHFTMVYAGSTGRFDLVVSSVLPRDR